MEKQFVEDEDLVTLVNEVILEHKMDHLAGVDIKSVLVYPEISKTVAGKCIKCNKELEHFGKFTYLLEFSGNLFESLTDKVKRILILHELNHIHITTDKKGNTKYKIRKHDVEDFVSIIKDNGIDWFLDLKTIASSVYDFQNGEQDNIKI
jgi:predicted metallopeptidase